MRLKPVKMRFDPPPAETEQEKKIDRQRVEAITRKIAITVAFIAVFIFFFKILFF
jgi:hypothetical protein